MTLLDVLPHDFRIRHGFAQALLLNGYARKGLDLLKTLKQDIPTEIFKSALNHYVWELRRKSKPEEALEVLYFNIQEFPDSHYFYFAISQIYEELGKLEEAVQYCRKALEIKPDFSEAAEMLKRLEEK